MTTTVRRELRGGAGFRRGFFLLALVSRWPTPETFSVASIGEGAQKRASKSTKRRQTLLSTSHTVCYKRPRLQLHFSGLEKVQK